MRVSCPAWLVTVACVGSSGGGGGGGGGGRSPEGACLDLIETLSDANVRCGIATYEESYDILLEGLACGDCGNVRGVRDMDELYEECLPSIETGPCDDLTGSPACRGQLPADQVDCP